MWAYAKVAMAVAVALLPGGFVVLLSYTAIRVLQHRWEEQTVRSGGRPVHMREVVHGLHWRDIVREARAAL